MGGFLIIIGIVLFCISRVVHVADSTMKAAGWVFLNLVMSIASMVCFLWGIVLVLAG